MPELPSEAALTQQAHNIYATSHQHRCNIASTLMLLHCHVFDGMGLDHSHIGKCPWWCHFWSKLKIRSNWDKFLQLTTHFFRLFARNTSVRGYQYVRTTKTIFLRRNKKNLALIDQFLLLTRGCLWSWFLR